MRKLSLISLLLIAAVSNILAQTPTDTAVWKTGGMMTLSFSQIALSNWAAGGQNSVTSTGLLNVFANYKRNTFTWDNNLDVGYGMTKRKDEDLIKSDDRIDLSSKLGKHAFRHWYYSGLFNLKSQMSPGYKYPDTQNKISGLFAPAYVVYAIGMDYKPNDKLTLFISPVTGKTTLVADQTLANAGAFGVDKAEYSDFGTLIKEGKRSRTELGGYFKMVYKTNLMENISLMTKLDLFSNYLENPQYIDVFWDALITMKINKYFAATINTTLIFDKDIDILIDETTGEKDQRVQFKEVFGFGFSYKF